VLQFRKIMNYELIDFFKIEDKASNLFHYPLNHCRSFEMLLLYINGCSTCLMLLIIYHQIHFNWIDFSYHHRLCSLKNYTFLRVRAPSNFDSQLFYSAIPSATLISNYFLLLNFQKCN